MLLTALLLAQTVPCPSFDVSTPGPFAAWHVEYDSLQVGTAKTLVAGDPERLSNLPVNNRTGSAAMVAFSIPVAGSYEIAIDQSGWIDLLRGFGGTKPIEPVSSRDGEPCSPLRRIFRFNLQPGIHRLYLSGLGKPAVRVMLVAGE